MGVQIVTAATDKAFTTLARVKVNLGLGTSTGDDSFLTDLIAEVSQIIVDETGREFAEEKVKETLKGSDRTTLLLTRTPIVSISSIVENYVNTITDYAIDDAEAGILYRRSGWTANVGSGWGIAQNYEASYQRPMYEITYTGGYVMANSSATSTSQFVLPASLRNVATSAVCMAYKHKSSDPSVLSKKVGDVSVSYGSTAADRITIASYIKANLGRWTRIA